MCDDMIKFILNCLGIETELKNINIIKLLQCINEWNGIENNNNNNDLKYLVMKLNKIESEILIDFLHFGAMSYLHRIPANWRSAIKIMEKIAKLSMCSKCIERAAILYYKLGKCCKKIGRNGDAIGYLTKSVECAETIGNIQIIRESRLLHVEIFDIENNNVSKEVIIEKYLEKKYNINKSKKKK
eukprot:41899_1